MKDQSMPGNEPLKELEGLRKNYNDLQALYNNDITRIRDAWTDLTVSETRYRRLFESAKDGILILNEETGMIMDVNPFLIELLGYSKIQFIEKTIWEIGCFKDIFANREKFLELQQKEYVRYENLPLEAADGRKIYVEFVSNVYSEGHAKVIQCNIRDISTRINAENELRKVNAFLDSIIENIPNMIFIKDSTTMQFIMFNKAGEDLLGIPISEMLGKSDHDIFLKEQADEFIENDRQVLLGKVMVDIPEEPIQTRRRGIRILHTKKVPILNDLGEPQYLLGISEDITEHIKKTEDLKIAKEHAEESNRLKSAFLANMSHEIRTPMNGILGFAELLKEPELTGEEQQKYIRVIEKSGTRMLNIINDIVNISKIESGQMEIFISETNLNEQIEFIYTFFKPQVEQKGMKIFFNNPLPGKEAIIRTDREKIYAILTNLVKNAIKFSHTGSIEIGYIKKGQWFEFFVKDTGVGINPELKETVFERFRQGSDSISRDYEGAGLGLSISKAYVEMLGGKISFESEVGKGSTFVFTIPDNNGMEDKNVITDTAPAFEEKEQLRNLKILIVEDDETSEMLIAMAVKLFSKEIIIARTGIEAVEICRNNADIDLVLMDIKMPAMDGYTATHQIRQFNKKVVIVAQSACALSEDREKAIEAGCNEYILKPFSIAALTVLLENIFQEKKTNNRDPHFRPNV
ncbi:MAG: PAS domain S-box protein [Bacteroidales bacterium]|nr:PAS domain S-box protein [Bacteroidales bacterium]